MTTEDPRWAVHGAEEDLMDPADIDKRWAALDEHVVAARSGLLDCEHLLSAGDGFWYTVGGSIICEDCAAEAFPEQLS